MIALGDKWVESVPLAIPGQRGTVVLRGRIDTAARFDDQTYGLLDYKTSNPRETHVAVYSRQLHCYSLAAENPAGSGCSFGPVSRMGLLVFQPLKYIDKADPSATVRADFGGGATWLPADRDDDAFLRFLSRVLELLERPTPPAASEDCSYCRYIEKLSRFRPAA